MPKATANTDRRRHGRGDNLSSKVAAKSNLADQRKMGAYAPKPPQSPTLSEFNAGTLAGKTMSAGVSIGKGTTRSMKSLPKLGGNG